MSSRPLYSKRESDFNARSRDSSQVGPDARWTTIASSDSRTHASRLANSGGEIDGALEIARESAAIDPYTFAALVAELEYRAGHRERALGEYRRALEIDPSDANAYLRVHELLAAEGRAGEGRDVLRRGIAHLSALSVQLRPVPDPSVPERYNRKAREVAEEVEASLRRLRQALAQSLRSERSPRGGGTP